MKGSDKMQFKKFKSLASTHIRKIAILFVISTLSSTILCSCGDDKNSTQIETMIEEETEETTTQKPDETETTTQKPDEAKTEQTERQNQDADPTEATATHQSNDTKPSTTRQEHVHKWSTETYYTTETQTVHHDAVTHQETTYTTETQLIERNGYLCDDGAFFTDEIAANEYCYEHLLGYCSWVKSETVTVQVPHTETVVDKPAWDETVEVQVAHTRNVCSECGATK